MNVRADLPQLEWRKLRQSYIDLGYGVGPDGSSCGGETMNGGDF